ncbi:MAG: hypothetical protein P3A28_01120 [Gemmatimonadota bacterium]|nr:hypothetical protein [Gemmatimonadota bacterium]
MSRHLVPLAVSLATIVACTSKPPTHPGPYGKEVAAAIPLVEKATGLTFKTPPKLEVRTRAELKAFLEAKFDEEQPALEMAGQEQAYRLFGLLPDTLDLRSFLLKLLAEQVIGYYDPATKVLYVVQDGAGGAAPSPDVLNITITHELVHALQDQYLPLDSIAKLRTDNDRTMAAQAVVEGGATYEQLSVMLGGSNMFARLPGGWDRVRQMIRDNMATMPVFATAPMFIQETLLFPYLSGAEFTRAFKEKRPGISTLTALPTSTEQVMHPGKLLDSTEAPIVITLPRPMGGTLVYENGLGEFETRLLLHQQLKNVAAASRAATGWGGDRYQVIRTANGAALSWLSVWDSPFDAAEFRFVMSEAMEKRFGLHAGAGGTGTVLRYAARGRSVVIRAVTVQGRPAVLYTDAPDGSSAQLLDLSRVKLTSVQ